MPNRDGGFLDMSDGMERLKNWASGKNTNPNPAYRQATKQQWGDNLAGMGGSKPATSKPKPKAKGSAKKVAMKPMKRGMKNAKKK